MQHFIWDIDPVLLSLGPLSIHWYGALFAAAIMSGLQVMKWVYQKENKNLEALDNLLMYAVFGIIIGARLGHCFFYDPQYYFANPLKILAIWEGGLASHGGGLGLINKRIETFGSGPYEMRRPSFMFDTWALLFNVLRYVATCLTCLSVYLSMYVP